MSSSSSSSSEPVKVLICGGSYAGLAAAVNLGELCAGRPIQLGDSESTTAGPRLPLEMTVVDERDGFFHLIGSPLALADAPYAKRAWQKYDTISSLQQPHLSFTHGSMREIDCTSKTATVQLAAGREPIEHRYDYMIAATGLRRVWPTVPQALEKGNYLIEAQGQIDQVQNAAHGVVIIGGGAVGIEMAAELKHASPSTQVTLIHSRDKLLSSEPLPDDFRDQTLEVLKDAGVEVVLGRRVIETVPGQGTDSAKTLLKLSDGSEISASHVVPAISKPTSTGSYLPPQTLTSDGLVRITNNLHFDPAVPNSTYHLAIGDIIDRPGIKRCGAAIYTGQLAAANIYQQALRDRGLSKEPVYHPYPDHPPAIVLAIGSQAIGYSKEHGGILKGEQLYQMFFEHDLGLGICWRRMGLGEPPADTKTAN